ncbi:MAG: hypothetical protein JWO82_645 [Akkermansiaceae bacterium]|nr:hypothetical protein [Akkermansiaceae bacterium]
MTPPSEASLEAVRDQTRNSVPGRSKLFSTPALPDSEEPVIPEPLRERPEIDPGDPTKPPTLSAYAEDAGKGGAAMIQLASYIEDNGYPARALLAWERVLDLCKPDAAQRDAAFQGIQRLRPTAPLWNVDPIGAKRLKLEVTVPPKATTPELTATVKAVADDLESITSGLVKFDSAVLMTKKGNPFKGLSLKIVGPGDKPAVTGTFQLEQMPESQDIVTYQLFSGIFRLVAAQMAETTAFTPPVAPSNGEDPRTALWQRISRLSWLEFAKSLQPPPPPAPPKEEKENTGRKPSGRDH